MQELLLKIQDRLPDHEYYGLLLKHSDDIINEIGMTSKKDVADKLGMSQQKFSTVFQLLLGYKYIISETEIKSRNLD